MHRQEEIVYADKSDVIAAVLRLYPGRENVAHWCALLDFTPQQVRELDSHWIDEETFVELLGQHTEAGPFLSAVTEHAEAHLSYSQRMAM